MDSILTSVKKMLGIEADYTHFDSDIIMFINSALFQVQQLGVGPSTSFFITGNTETWTTFLSGRTDIEAVKILVYMKVRLMFDPPIHEYVINAIERQIRELEWRLNAQVDKYVPEVTAV